jgi:hypothetical protein
MVPEFLQSFGSEVKKPIWEPSTRAGVSPSLVMVNRYRLCVEALAEVGGYTQISIAFDFGSHLGHFGICQYSSSRKMSPIDFSLTDHKRLEAFRNDSTHAAKQSRKRATYKLKIGLLCEE